MLGIVRVLHTYLSSFMDVVELWLRIRKTFSIFKFVPAISDCLRFNSPASILSVLPLSNISAVLANRCIGGYTRVVVGIHADYSEVFQEGAGSEEHIWPPCLPVLTAGRCPGCRF